MAAINKIFPVTEKITGKAFDLGSIDIIRVTGTSDASVEFLQNKLFKRYIVLEETAQDVSYAAQNLVFITTALGDEYLNVDKIVHLEANGSGCDIYYKDAKEDISKILSTDSISTIRTRITDILSIRIGKEIYVSTKGDDNYVSSSDPYNLKWHCSTLAKAVEIFSSGDLIILAPGTWTIDGSTEVPAAINNLRIYISEGATLEWNTSNTTNCWKPTATNFLLSIVGRGNLILDGGNAWVIDTANGPQTSDVTIDVGKITAQNNGAGIPSFSCAMLNKPSNFNISCDFYEQNSHDANFILAGDVYGCLNIRKKLSTTVLESDTTNNALIYVANGSASIERDFWVHIEDGTGYANTFQCLLDFETNPKLNVKITGKFANVLDTGVASSYYGGILLYGAHKSVYVDAVINTFGVVPCILIEDFSADSAYFKGVYRAVNGRCIHQRGTNTAKLIVEAYCYSSGAANPAIQYLVGTAGQIRNNTVKNPNFHAIEIDAGATLADAVTINNTIIQASLAHNSIYSPNAGTKVSIPIATANIALHANVSNLLAGMVGIQVDANVVVS